MEWVGWCWDGEQWDRVCRASTMRDCHVKLNECCRKRNIPSHWAGMTGGQSPMWNPDKKPEKVYQSVDDGFCSP